jgi:hypothetical protein
MTQKIISKSFIHFFVYIFDDKIHSLIIYRLINK